MTTADLNAETRAIWDANAEVWDAKMGDEGNSFVNILQWPVIRPLLNVGDGSPTRPQRILDIACGNGLFSRRLAALGAQVTAFDFSAELIKLARARGGANIDYRVLDVTDERALLNLGAGVFDAALCNMALFDIADIRPLFHALPKLLRSPDPTSGKPGGVFVFSLMHPAFNNSSTVHMAEGFDDESGNKVTYSVKVSRYMTPYHAHGLALLKQPKPQIYFERPLQYYFKLGFENGFVLDGFEERAFPPDKPASAPLSWGGQFSEIPPVLVARMRLI
ncbi:MAG: methyltransferase domain-containing protein [Anaerolineales bacterium]